MPSFTDLFLEIPEYKQLLKAFAQSRTELDTVKKALVQSNLAREKAEKEAEQAHLMAAAEREEFSKGFLHGAGGGFRN